MTLEYIGHMSASVARMQVGVLFRFLILIKNFVILPVYVLPVYVYVFKLYNLSVYARLSEAAANLHHNGASIANRFVLHLVLLRLAESFRTLIKVQCRSVRS